MIGEYPVRTLLGDDNYLPSVLGGISQSARVGERKLDRLRDAMVRLARTGTPDREVLRTAEQKLPVLIQRLWDNEQKAKEGINPQEAGERAAISRVLPDVVEKLCSDMPIIGDEPFWDKTLTPASPNEIDAEQINALRRFHDFHLAREAIETILDAVRRINSILRMPPRQEPRDR